jgi:hypothetical protein
MLPQLNLLNMSVNALHRNVYQTMQDILNQRDIRTELKMKLNELETVLEENEKIERKAVELKFTATEECNNAARRVQDIEIANIKEEIKQEKQRIKHDIVHPLKRVHDKCTRCTEISSGLQEENVTEQVTAYFVELDAMYADLIKKMMVVVICFLLGNSPASEFYMPTFRNTVCSIFIGK